MKECYCQNCGKLVKTKNFPCNGSYACSIACLLKVTNPASTTIENKDVPKVTYRKIAKKQTVLDTSKTAENVTETKD